MRTQSEHKGDGGDVKVVLAAGAGNLAIAAAKFVGAALTGSSAMFSEGVHSLVDTGNQALMLLGFRSAERPPTERYPFGHGREIYFYAFVVAVLLFALGSGVSLYEGLHKLSEPEPLKHPWVNYAVLAFGFVAEGFSWTVAYREFNRTRPRGLSLVRAVRQSKDPSVFVVLFEDSAAMLGLLAALGGVVGVQVTGILVLDGVASLAISAILAVTAVFLAIETKGLLIGEAARPEVQRQISDAVACTAFTKKRLMTVHFGPEDVLVALEVGAPAGWTAERLSQEVRDLESRIRARVPEASHIFVEACEATRPPAQDGPDSPPGASA